MCVCVYVWLFESGLDGIKLGLFVWFICYEYQFVSNCFICFFFQVFFILHWVFTSKLDTNSSVTSGARCWIGVEVQSRLRVKLISKWFPKHSIMQWNTSLTSNKCCIYIRLNVCDVVALIPIGESFWHYTTFDWWSNGEKKKNQTPTGTWNSL